MEKLKEKEQDNIVRETDPMSADNNLSSQEENSPSKEWNETGVPIAEPVKQLEQRFKETMEKVAELTEEKQKLEHLVLQLQNETETIGMNELPVNKFVAFNFIFTSLFLSPFFLRRVYNIISETKGSSTE